MRILILLETRDEQKKYTWAQLHDPITDLLDQFPQAVITVSHLSEEHSIVLKVNNNLETPTEAT